DPPGCRFSWTTPSKKFVGTGNGSASATPPADSDSASAATTAAADLIRCRAAIPLPSPGPATGARVTAQDSRAGKSPEVKSPTSTGPPGPVPLQVAADEHRFGGQLHAEALEHPVAHLAGEFQQVCGGGPTPVGQGQGVLGRQPRRRLRARVAEGVAGAYDQPAARQLR